MESEVTASTTHITVFELRHEFESQQGVFFDGHGEVPLRHGVPNPVDDGFSFVAGGSQVAIADFSGSHQMQHSEEFPFLRQLGQGFGSDGFTNGLDIIRTEQKEENKWSCSPVRQLPQFTISLLLFALMENEEESFIDALSNLIQEDYDLDNRHNWCSIAFNDLYQ